MKKFNFLFVLLLLNQFSYSQNGGLIITEVMFNTSNSNAEFVEIYNSSSKSINLQTLQLKYSTSKTDDLIVIGNNQNLESKSYAIIIEKDYNFEENIYNLDSDAIILTTVDNSFGSSGMANKSDREISLILNNSDTLDTYTYSADNPEDYSDERVDLLNVFSDWKNSAIQFGTPLKRNSTAKLDFDLEAEIIKIRPEKIIYKSPFYLDYSLSNKGYKKCTKISLKVFIDFNRDSTLQNNEVIHSSYLGELAAEDSLNRQIKINDIYPNKYLIGIVAEGKQDENLQNNKDFEEITIFQPVCNYNDIIINEIMFAPFSEEPEWFEIYNKSEKTINLKNWLIKDEVSSTIINESKIKSQEYLVIAKDDSFLDFYEDSINYIITQFPSLNNSEDQLVLKDSLGITIDSVLYNYSWINNQKGFSAERMSPDENSNYSENWKKSVARGTPGKINSLTRKDYNVKIDSVFTTPELVLLNDSFLINAVITNYGKKDCLLNLVLFKINNKDSNKISFIDNLVILPNSKEILQFPDFFTAESDSINFIIKLIPQNDYDTTNNVRRLNIKPVSINGDIKFSEIMFDPAEEENEWIEIYNNSDFPVNLKSWSIINYSEKSFHQYFINESKIIEPDEFLIITSDKSFFDEDKNILELKFGSLSSSSEKLKICNYNNSLSDSINYDNSWESLKHHSLEKIDLIEKNEKTNWHFSVSEKLSTPGENNSVSDLQNYFWNEVVINEILFNPEEGGFEFIELKNNSNFEINLAGWKLFDNSSEYIISGKNIIILPGDYFLLSNGLFEESNFSKIDLGLSLSNSGEKLLLKDIFRNVIDSLTYSDKWHNSNISEKKGKSLEKIKTDLISDYPENWSTSVADYGSTPLKENSINLKNPNYTQNEVKIFPNPFSPDNDGFEDFTEISFSFNNPVSQLIIKIFDDEGYLVRNLKNFSAYGSEGKIIFDGKDESGIPLNTGIYILLFEAYDIDTKNKTQFVKPVVIARKL